MSPVRKQPLRYIGQTILMLLIGYSTLCVSGDIPLSFVDSIKFCEYLSIFDISMNEGLQNVDRLRDGLRSHLPYCTIFVGSPELTSCTAVQSFGGKAVITYNLHLPPHISLFTFIFYFTVCAVDRPVLLRPPCWSHCTKTSGKKNFNPHGQLMWSDQLGQSNTRYYACFPLV